MTLDIGNPFWQYNMPEYELEGYWTCKINDNDVPPGKRNSMLAEARIIKGFDKYIQNVSIPQMALEGKVNDYGLMNVEGKSPYDDVQLTFYDDIYGTCLAFFTDWLHFVFDEHNHCLKQNWRYEAKSIQVAYFRQYSIGIKPISCYKMRKCLPKSIAEISADEEVSGRKTFSVTLMTQKVETVTPKSITKVAGGDNLTPMTLGDVFL